MRHTHTHTHTHTQRERERERENNLSQDCEYNLFKFTFKKILSILMIYTLYSKIHSNYMQFFATNKNI